VALQIRKDEKQMTWIKLIRMLAVIVGLAAIFGIVSEGFALPDYSKTKGDFKILNIGNTRADVLKKLTYLETEGEITGVSGTDQFQGEALGEKITCYLRYHSSFPGGERVRQIVIDFTTHHEASGEFETESKGYAQYLRAMLEKIYGPPSYARPYLFLSQLKPDQEKYWAKWVFPTKIIGIALVNKTDFIATQIIISSRLLNQELQKDEIQDFN
jgi:hypothetical protein